ncbi:MAG: AAA-ATPase like protein, partial [Pseudomonadota bacterium]|nr:AAA-ATPase like protein [Pseudomonadota bacterium]
VINEAETQLQQYVQDARVREVLGPATLHPLILVYSGWELVYRAEWAEVAPATPLS